MSEHDIHQNETTMGENPGAEGDFGAGQGREGQSADHAAHTARHPHGTEQPRREELVDDDIDDAGEDEPIPGIDDATEPGLLVTPNDYDEGQTLAGGIDDGIENNFDEGQSAGGVPGNRPGPDHGPAHRHDGDVL